LSESGLCSKEKPKLKGRVGRGGKEYHSIRFNTFTYNDFNVVHDLFYMKKTCNKGYIKVVPGYKILEAIINPLALATWIMDDGSKENSGGMLLHTNSFSLRDVNRLQTLLKNKFNLDSSLRLKWNAERTVEYPLIYIRKKEMDKVRSLVKDHFSEDMLRKL
jgi:hypothetical protein